MVNKTWIKLEFDFGQRDEESNEPVDFSGHAPLGECPKCSARVFEHGMSYICEKSVGPERNCDFRSGKVILQQEIGADQMTKLLSTGKTDLLEGFVSSRTNRKFKAYLSRGEGGKVSFEFEARPEKPGRKTPTKTAAKKTTKTAAKTAVKKAAKKAVKTTATKTATKKAVKKAVKKVAKKVAKKAVNDVTVDE
jgi:DNA topoisomerase-3